MFLARELRYGHPAAQGRQSRGSGQYLRSQAGQGLLGLKLLQKLFNGLIVTSGPRSHVSMGVGTVLERLRAVQVAVQERRDADDGADRRDPQAGAGVPRRPPVCDHSGR